MTDGGEKTRLGLVILAAGRGQRFGSNKLMAEVLGKPLYLHAFDAVPQDLFYKTAVVSRGEILDAGEKRGFIPAENPSPELGQSLSVRLGLEKLRDCDGIMFMTADQPLLKKETVAAMARSYKKAPRGILSLGTKERRGSPVIFSSKYFDELAALTGDVGGSAVIRDHKEELSIFEIADERELFDVDTAEDLIKTQKQCI